MWNVRKQADHVCSHYCRASTEDRSRSFLLLNNQEESLLPLWLTERLVLYDTDGESVDLEGEWGSLRGKECCSSWAVTMPGVNLMCNLDKSHLQANCCLHTQNDLFVDKERGGKVATGLGLWIRPNIIYWRKT